MKRLKKRNFIGGMRVLTASWNFIHHGDDMFSVFLMEAILQGESIIISYPTEVELDEEYIGHLQKYTNEKSSKVDKLRIDYLDRVCVPFAIDTNGITDSTIIHCYWYGTKGDYDISKEKYASFSVGKINHIEVDSDFVIKVKDKMNQMKENKQNRKKDYSLVQYVDLDSYEQLGENANIKEFEEEISKDVPII